MSGGWDSELTSFHRFISEQLSVGHGNVSPEEALDLWRSQHPAADADEDVLAVQEALADMENGDEGLLLEEFDIDFRLRHGLGAKYTHRGRTYRLLFIIAGNQVRVLRVRGAGQSPLKSRDLG